MSEDRTTRRAKAAASETIGKLIGDDDAIRKGRDEKRAAKPKTNTKTQKQE
jgi:uncharacterized protein YjbJ (UPF0337 family)